MSFASVTSTLKLKTHSQLTQNLLTATDGLFLCFYYEDVLIFVCFSNEGLHMMCVLVMRLFQCLSNVNLPMFLFQ